MKSTLRILAVYRSKAVNHHSDISAVYSMRPCVRNVCVCAHGNNSPVLAEATGLSTERLTVCVVSVSGAASNTQNTMWFFYVDVGWGTPRGAGLV